MDGDLIVPSARHRINEVKMHSKGPYQSHKLRKLDSMTKTRQQWEAEMERLNNKYNLDCFSNSELDSESDKGEEYQYEHGYETLI